MQNLKKFSGINLLTGILILAGLSGFAQNQNAYFQQKADYTIHVKLDDNNHSLHGTFKLEYHNNSPDTLNEIYFHLYPNAYKNQNTALAKQLERTGEGAFYYSKESERGYIDSLAFEVNGDDALLREHPDHIDIAILELNKPLFPGESIIIGSPFYVKIPGIFSRLGHFNNAYYITQWYPKPAVYDNEGWHAFPYLNLGEFYSEYGDYEVSIELPSNYRVAASGLLQNQDEREWLIKLPDTDSLTFPKSDSTFKTLLYKGENIHDFAWFADKRFCVRQETYQKDKEIWAFFLPGNQRSWEKVPKYIKQTLDFYSDEIGELPYPSVSAVQGHPGIGGGMEYPGVTLISNNFNGRILENIVMHEVGHNWFYGVLGFNERNFPWLDEGLNSFYEHLYMNQYYPELRTKDMFNPLGKDSYSEAPYHGNAELTYKFTQSLGIDQAVNLSSEEYNMLNYGSIIYKKTVSIFYYLRYYLGEEEFKLIMHSFYDEWKNKHPGPEDFREHFKNESGKDLSWFFDGLVGTTQGVDYKICESKGDSITIKNKGKIPGPLFLSHQGREYTIDGFNGKKTIQIDDLQKGDRIEIDPKFKMLEDNRNNNLFKNKSFSHSKPVKLKFFGGIDDFKAYELYYVPVPAFNAVDGFMPGLLLYNNLLPVKKLEYRIMPLYGVRSNSLTGTANIHYRKHFKESKWLRTTGIEASAKQFSILKDLQYQKFKGSFYMDFKLKAHHQKLQFSTHFITTSTNSNSPLHFQQAIISMEDWSEAYPFNIYAKAERGPAHYKIELEGKLHIGYNEKKGLDIRLFAGTMNYFNTTAQYLANFRLSGNSNISDYLFDMNSVNRSVYMSDYEVLGARQFVPDQGGFSLYTPAQSTQMLSLGLNSGTPLPMIHLYANFGIIPELFEANNFYETKLLYDTGIELQIIKDVLEIYFPINASNKLTEINENLYSENYFQKIRFRLSLDLVNPWDMRFKSHLLF